MYDYHMDSLEHYGVKGMKWGVRRKAKKDAKEFARAKMYYGEGAGTRRKLIKARVEERSKDSGYKEAFDTALSKQNMSSHATKAKVERRTKTAYNTTTKTARGLINLSTGGGRASALAVGIAGTYGYMKMTGTDKVVVNAGKQAAESIMRQFGLR